MQHNELVGAAIVEPLVEAQGLPDWIEVHAYGIGARDDASANQIVPVEKAPRDWFSDAINVYWRCEEKSGDVSRESDREKREHEDAKPAQVKTIAAGQEKAKKRTPRAVA
jgi:hypothetical protein